MLFSRFGPVTEATIWRSHKGDSSRPNFAFINFASETSAINAIKESKIRLKVGNVSHVLTVEKRKDRRRKVDPRHAPRVFDHAHQAHNHSSRLPQPILQMNWQKTAATYLFRVVTMEGYVASYINALASYRETEEESVEELMQRVIAFSKSCPEDVLELMPPSVSGLVSNQTFKEVIGPAV